MLIAVTNIFRFALAGFNNFSLVAGLYWFIVLLQELTVFLSTDYDVLVSFMDFIR